MLKLQMAAVAEVCLPFAQVHDEIDFYVEEAGRDEITGELVERMEGVECPFKLKVEAAYGPNLGEMTRWEGLATERR